MKALSMLNNEEVISLYEKVSHLTAEMLKAAHKQDWELFNWLESQCIREISALKSAGGVSPVLGDLRLRKVAILQKIMRDDRAIRDATQPWLSELQTLIFNTGNQRLT